MAMFKPRTETDWKKNYIIEFNEMRDSYEKKLQKKQMEIDTLDEDIQKIKDLREIGLSYGKIANKTRWSKATISRVLNGLYD